DLFIPFSQEDDSFCQNKGGVGLGLSIIHNLVISMNGKIEVQSKKAVGTTFKVILPFEQVNESTEDISGVPNQPINKIYYQGVKRVLVAEDDEDASFLIKNFLDDENLKIDFVVNGKELITQNSKQPYDLILTDLRMPELDGISAIKRLRAEGVITPILALSAHALMEEKEKAIAAGANGILSKPFNKESLNSFISDFLN
ncbi:MAG: response regulator, partial [Bacteriovoracaceae bacterium]|nr:response regulator [Bacteriovoracaceae bacterium]